MHDLSVRADQELVADLVAVGGKRVAELDGECRGATRGQLYARYRVECSELDAVAAHVERASGGGQRETERDGVGAAVAQE